MDLDSAGRSERVKVEVTSMTVAMTAVFTVAMTALCSISAMAPLTCDLQREQEELLVTN